MMWLSLTISSMKMEKGILALKKLNEFVIPFINT